MPGTPKKGTVAATVPFNYYKKIKYRTKITKNRYIIG
jgi:hypothetical protein